MVSMTQQAALLRGDVLIDTRSHAGQGAAVTAQMYVPLVRSHLWEQLTDYSRWVHYFPDITQSRELEASVKQHVKQQSKRITRKLYQAARKAFILFTAQVEIYLHVVEHLHQSIQFRLERGTFADFSADLVLEDFGDGTLLTYSVRATPMIPAPKFLLEQAMRIDLPGNLKTMRRVLCKS
ncbi:MAG: SRPBCC family protein [Cyanobacteria bacterium P01_D01_bin.156]